jgi:hypothetical protein
LEGRHSPTWKPELVAGNVGLKKSQYKSGSVFRNL